MAESIKGPTRTWFCGCQMEVVRQCGGERCMISQASRALDILVAEGVISAGKHRELMGMTIEQQRERWRQAREELADAFERDIRD